jgi:hypothetical protein
MRVIRLKTEYLENSIALETTSPRFSGIICENCTKQTAYRITAKRDDEMFWDSGRVISDQMILDRMGKRIPFRFFYSLPGVWVASFFRPVQINNSATNPKSNLNIMLLE